MFLPPSGKKSYSSTIIVTHNDIDELGHVNNVVYVKWVQEVAAAHWDLLAPSDIKQRYLWVVLRHEIDYVSAAFEGDIITAITWVGESHGARSERFVTFIHEKDDKVIAKAKTTWCLLDGRTLKPRRVDENIIRLLIG